MSEVNNSNESLLKGLSIAGLVVGIIALLVSFIPCFGMYAMYIGVVGLLISGGAIFVAMKNDLPKGLAIAAIVVSVIAFIIAYTQYRALTSGLQELGTGLEGFGNELNKGLKELNDSLQNN